MGLKCLVLFCWFFMGLFSIVTSDNVSEEVTVKFLKTPRVITNSNAAKFTFRTLVGSNGSISTNYTTTCKVICYAIQSHTHTHTYHLIYVAMCYTFVTLSMWVAELFLAYRGLELYRVEWVLRCQMNNSSKTLR